MMNPSVKRAWVEALRSGEYQQVEGRLYDRYRDGYCCLGVLCDVIDPHRWLSNGAYEAVIDGEVIRMHDALDELVLGALGMPEAEADRLMDMNDQDCKSFDEIADYIESSPNL